MTRVDWEPLITAAGQGQVKYLVRMPGEPAPAQWVDGYSPTAEPSPDFGEILAAAVLNDQDAVQYLYILQTLAAKNPKAIARGMKNGAEIIEVNAIPNRHILRHEARLNHLISKVS